MASRDAVVAQEHPALVEIKSVCEEIDPEAASKLTRFTPGGVVPTSVNRRDEFDLFIAESLLLLARAVRGRKRGRKPNVVLHGEDEK